MLGTKATALHRVGTKATDLLDMPAFSGVSSAPRGRLWVGVYLYVSVCVYFLTEAYKHDSGIRTYASKPKYKLGAYLGNGRHG